MNPLHKLTLTATLVSVAGFGAQAQYGAACGCPPVLSRPTEILSESGAVATAYTTATGDMINASTVLTCDKIWRIKKKTYVGNNQDLYIEPGTIIKTDDNAGTNANALIISRGGQIWANGSESCPIIFTTTADPVDGTYPITNRGKWGGLLILGRAFNNVATGDSKDGVGVSPAITGTDGVGAIEGLDPLDSRNWYGMPHGSELADDNSGVLRHVSLRHGGELLSTANEINGLTLGSVGSGTTIEHIEVVGNLDDAFEFFGGTVNARYLIGMHCDDDYIDYDQGYTGKIQFMYGLQGPDNGGGALNQGDNGIECDGDDGPGNTYAKSNPTIYNVTIISRQLASPASSDESIESRREPKGTIANCVFATPAGYRGLNMSTDAAVKWNANEFNVKNCTFQGQTVPLRINGVAPASGSAEQLKFAADGNLTVAEGSLIDATYSMNVGSNAIVGNNRVNPVPAAGTATTTIVPPVDGFFTGAKYRGAFEPGAPSWVPSYAVATDLGTDLSAVVGCTGDLDRDGDIDSIDFGVFVNAYGDTCY